MFVQIITGFLLRIHYRSQGFDAVFSFSRESFFGETLRFFHANFVSAIFFRLYLHVFRGVGNLRFYLMPVWGSGLILFLLTVIAAFLGYVLP